MDIQRIAVEIEEVGKSEQHSLATRMGVLFTHLLEWHHQQDPLLKQVGHGRRLADDMTAEPAKSR
jgi:hypothetical protein